MAYDWNNSSVRGSYKELDNTASQGWNNSAFGATVDTSSINDYFNNYQSLGDISKGVKAEAKSGAMISAAFQAEAIENLYGAFTDGDQYAAVADAAGSAALNYIQSKLQRIKDLWHQKSTVTVGSLVGEVAPMAMHFTDIPKLIYDKSTSLIGYLTDTKGGTLGELATNFGTDVLSSILGDSGLQSSISQLQIVQAYGNALNGVASLIDTGRRIMDRVEPALPYIEIITNFAMVWINAAAANEGAQKVMEEAARTIQKLLALAAEPFRKLVFNIKLSVPQLLVGAWNSLSVREATSWYGDNSYKWMMEVFNGEYYNDVTNSLQWQKSINNALNETVGTVTDWSKFSFISDNSDIGKLMKSKFLNSVVQNYMWGADGAVARAKSAAHIMEWANKSWIWAGEGAPSKIEGDEASEWREGLQDSISTLLGKDIDDLPTDEIGIQQITKKIYENQR